MANKNIEAEPVEKEQKFPVSQLQRFAYELFDVPTSTFVGATTGLNGEYTVEEVRKIISEWKEKEAK